MERDKRSNMGDDVLSLSCAGPILIWGVWPSGCEKLIKVFVCDVAQSLSSSSRRLLSDTLTTVSPSKRRPS